MHGCVLPWMCVCLCVCMFDCLNLHICVCVCSCACMCVELLVQKMHVCVCVCFSMFACACGSACLCARACMCMHPRMKHARLCPPVVWVFSLRDWTLRVKKAPAPLSSLDGSPPLSSCVKPHPAPVHLSVHPFSGLCTLLAQGTYGPFVPMRQCQVPLWLALLLKEKKKCSIRPPEWMQKVQFPKPTLLLAHSHACVLLFVAGHTSPVVTLRSRPHTVPPCDAVEAAESLTPGHCVVCAIAGEFTGGTAG